MSLTNTIKQVTTTAIEELYHVTIAESAILVNATKPEFEGDYTVVLFAFVKQLKRSPDTLGNELGAFLQTNHSELFSAFNINKGFLNLSVTDQYWQGFLEKEHTNISYGIKEKNGERVMVEYSSPNTNKPLHLGHLRNNFLDPTSATSDEKLH